MARAVASLTRFTLETFSGTKSIVTIKVLVEVSVGVIFSVKVKVAVEVVGRTFGINPIPPLPSLLHVIKTPEDNEHEHKENGIEQPAHPASVEKEK